MVSGTDPDGRTTWYEYDSRDPMIWITDAWNIVYLRNSIRRRRGYCHAHEGRVIPSLLMLAYDPH